MPFNPALGRQSQADLCEFEVSLAYRVSSRTARVTQRNPVLETNTHTTGMVVWQIPGLTALAY